MHFRYCPYQPQGMISSLGQETEIYDPRLAMEFFSAHPDLVIRRLAQLLLAATGYVIQVATLRIQGASEANTEGERLRSTLVWLGPTAVKLGQTLSTRPDLLGEETCASLALLQDGVEPFDTDVALSILESEVGVPLSVVFSEFSPQPIAAASLGQVYKGRLADGGTEVAVKVQRPGALEAVALDVFILRCALGLLRRIAGIGQDIRLVADEIGSGLYGELDYRQEGRNSEMFRSAHAALGFVEVPSVVWQATTRLVLVTEWVEGESPSSFLSDSAAGCADPAAALASASAVGRLVAMGVECSLVQLLETGVMHADPHPGNLMLDREGRLVYLDHGLLSIVEPKYSKAMFRALLHLVLEDFDGLVADLDSLDLLKPTTRRDALADDLREEIWSSSRPTETSDLSRPPESQSFSSRLLRAMTAGDQVSGGRTVVDVGWGQLARALAKLALRYRFRLPPYLILVARSLTTLEGLALQVDPSFKVLRAALPTLGRRLLMARAGEEQRLLTQLILTADGRIKPALLSVACGELKARTSKSHGAQSTFGAQPRRPMPGCHRLAGLLRVLLCSANLSAVLSEMAGPVAAPLRAYIGQRLSERWVGGPCPPEDVKADRLPSHWLRAKYLRLYVKSLAHKTVKHSPLVVLKIIGLLFLLWAYAARYAARTVWGRLQELFAATTPGSGRSAPSSASSQPWLEPIRPPAS